MELLQKDYLGVKETLNGRTFRVPLGSFYQVNPEVAEHLFNTTKEWLNDLPQPRVIDAFLWRRLSFYGAGAEAHHWH